MIFCPKCGAQNKDEAKFCRKCGAGLEAYTSKIRQSNVKGPEAVACNARETVSGPEEEDPGLAYEDMTYAPEQPTSKKELRRRKKADRKAAKKAKKRARSRALTTGQKIRRFFLRLIALLFMLLLLGSVIIGALVYFEKVDIPEISYIMARSGLQRREIPDIDPTKHNYVPQDDETVFDEEAGRIYANDIILVIFSNDASDAQKKDVVSFLDGELVGSVPDLNMCQIKIKDHCTLEELKKISDKVESKFDFVIYATYDTAAIDTGNAYCPNDPWNKDVSKKDWEDGDIDGSNWGLEAIDAAEAWDYNKELTEIIVGVSDSSFDVGHEDIKNKVSFVNDVLEWRNVTDPWWSDWDNLKNFRWGVLNQENCHGTHVVGIIGAEGNNRKGMTGLVSKCKILLAPLYRNQEHLYLAWDTSIYANLSYLVEAGAKVVNFSQGKTNFLSESMPEFSKEFIEREGRLAAIFTAKLLDKNYDFIVVQSAGNGRTNGKDHGIPVDALQNGLFSSITDESPTGSATITTKQVRDHVIIVGAAEKAGAGFRCTSFSNFGKQIDICAPGKDIYSTIPGELHNFEFFGGYGYLSGTSMAAPIVTGVCALTWSADRTLSAKEVKDIVCTNYKAKVAPHPRSGDHTSYNLVNAKLSVEAALDFHKNGGIRRERPKKLSSKRDIVLVLDGSGSMRGKPIQETRKAAQKFVETMLGENANVGLVVYNDRVCLSSDISADKKVLKDAVAKINAGGNTNIEVGFSQAKLMLDAAGAKKNIIVLMSDGAPNRGKVGDELVEYADELKNEGVIIYTIGFFENLDDSKSDEQLLMERIASKGCHYEVADADDLVFFFEDIGDQISGQKYIYIRIACPVDVYVNHNGQTLDSSEENLNLRTDFGTLSFEDQPDQERRDKIKVLRLKEGVDYDVQLYGTDRGIMDYTIGFMDEEGEYSDFRKFENIRITKKTVIDTVATVADESVLNIDDDGDGKYDLRLMAKANGYGEEVKQFKWIYILACGIFAVLMLIIIIITAKARKRRKNKKNMRQSRR